MSYDWFVDINEKYKPQFNAIADLDKKIKDTKDEKTKKTLETKRKKLWSQTWEEISKIIPFYSSLIQMLSSGSFEQESPSLQNILHILRERYIEMILTEKEQISNCLAQLTGFYEIFKTPRINEIDRFPLFSFFIQFSFRLAMPYISHDDEEFYICDNPVRKDRVFKVPMVSGSTWKGNMRWTAGKQLEMDTDIDKRLNKRIHLTNLFGNENEAEEKYFDSLMPEKKDDFKTIMKNLSNKEGLRRGRLKFYPTFFDRISLEVINPHDRKTKAGTVPIFIESVPEGATGTFSLLYVPFDLMGKPSEEIKQEVTDDINIFYDSLKEMMLTYGFSAKKSSGFGIIKEGINGIFEISGKKDKTNQIKPEPIKPTPAKKKTYSTFGELLSSIQPTKQDNSLTFSSFEKLKDIISQVKAEVMKNAG